MPFTLPYLPFARDALAPHMSAETLDFHHGKHHQTYVTKTNELVAAKGLGGANGLAGAKLTEVIAAAKASGDTELFNNAAQLWNHSFFWQCLAPEGSTLAYTDQYQRQVIDHASMRRRQQVRFLSSPVFYFPM